MTRIGFRKIAAGSALAAATVLVTACGGGGGGSSPAPISVSPPPPPPPPPTSQAPTWTQNVFDPASTFKDQCAAPRTGVDAVGDAFPDEAGSLLEELFWLRSWTEETYLWYDEVNDVDPNGFNDVLSYFDVLKTDAQTPSGQPRDRFHFTANTADDLARRLSAPEPAYGAELVVISNSIPRDWRILYTEPNTPASDVVNGQPQLVRG
ncbi:MAG: peptidase, partial [Pseudomonadota bacterium]